MNLYFILQQSLLIMVSLMIVALGGLFSERSGVINIALEGIMAMGAFASILFINIFEKMVTGNLLYLLAMVVAIVAGMLFSAFHAFAAINVKADQTISGTALNMFAAAFVVYVARLIFHNKDIPFTNTFYIRAVPYLSKIPVIGDIFFKNAYISTYIAIIILIIASFVLYKTRFGLRLRASGENPQAVDAAGINVYRIRWTAVLISGGLAGLGGLYYVITTSTAFSGTVAGYGFLALAILIFGQWKPLYILFSSLFFAFFMALASASSTIPFLNALKIPGEFLNMIPYLATLVVLFFSSKKSQAPKGSGEPYDQGKR